MNSEIDKLWLHQEILSSPWPLSDQCEATICALIAIIQPLVSAQSDQSSLCAQVVAIKYHDQDHIMDVRIIARHTVHFMGFASYGGTIVKNVLAKTFVKILYESSSKYIH